MKVTQFTNTTDDGGAETLILSLTQQLLERGIDTEIHGFNDSWIIQRCIDLNLPHFVLNSKFKKIHSIRKLPLWGINYGRLLKQRNINVLHSHVYGATLRGAASSWWNNIIHVATQHDNHSVTDKMSRCRWLNVSGALGTKIVLISKQMMDTYVGHCVKEKYCTFVYNGVDGKRFEPNKPAADVTRRQLNISNDEFMFVAPARLQPIKGFDILIKAFTLIRELPFRLFILGSGPERGNLEKMVQEANLQHKIHFLGAVNNVEDYLSAADAFTLASRNEGLPCSIIEAMFAKLPVITTGVGGNAELVLQGENGYLVQPENDNVLAIALRASILRGKGRLEEMGAVSYQHAQNFTLNAMTNNYLKLYSK